MRLAEFQILEEIRLHRAADESGDKRCEQQASELHQREKDEERQRDSDRELALDLPLIFEQAALEEENDGVFRHFEHAGLLNASRKREGCR